MHNFFFLLFNEKYQVNHENHWDSEFDHECDRNAIENNSTFFLDNQNSCLFINLTKTNSYSQEYFQGDFEKQSIHSN